jgi:hypothetical protein
LVERENKVEFQEQIKYILFSQRKIVMAKLHHQFNRIVHRTYVSPYATCLNSDPKHRHSIRSDIAWVAERADGEIGPVGPDCAEAIAKKLDVRLRDFPDLIRARDETPENPSGHGGQAGKKSEFNDKAAGRLSKSRSYVRDYSGVVAALKDIGLNNYFARYLPYQLKKGLSAESMPENDARAFMKKAEATSEFNIDRLQTMHKLLKRLTLMREDCLRHALPPHLRNPDWDEIDATPNSAKTPDQWIAIGQTRLSEYIRRFISRADNRKPGLTDGEMTFCHLLAVKDLGRSRDYFGREEFSAFVHANETPGQKSPTGNTGELRQQELGLQ